MDREDRLRLMRRQLKPHRDTLFAFERVAHVDVGYRYEGGVPTNKLAVRLFVHGPKRSRQKAKAYVLAPRRFRGLPIDVVCGTFVKHCQARRDPSRGGVVRPLVGGIAISTAQDETGTLGVVVRANDGRTIGLTADHVVHSSPEIFQPPCGSGTEQQVGHAMDVDALLSSVALDLTGTATSVGVLRGLRQPLVRAATDSEMDALIAHRVPVWKSGERSGVTQGFVSGYDRGVVSVSDSSGTQVPEVACGGDSGSIWVTAQGIGVGLHYGGLARGSSEAIVGWAQSLSAIAVRFGLAL